jgi:hypothetical protein
MIGLTQKEAATLCIMSRDQAMHLEGMLREFGCRLPVQSSPARRVWIRETWSELIANACTGDMSESEAIARREVQS